MELAICPVCKKQSLLLSMRTEEIPYFGKIIILTTRCENCKFKHADVFTVEIKEPLSYKIRVECEEDLNTKVIRSSSGTIIIPELGIKIEPGTHAQGFITNIEGILERIEKVLKFQLKTQKVKKLRKVKELLAKVEKMRNGKLGFTLILKDPFGNSGIISKKAKKRRLSKRELKNLKTGLIILEMTKK
ncbi:MAG: hypothetical protein DRN07_07880 [Thermoplasmata archaeon]|nr:MAG: hypothetical protein DRN07_07880 [Thermoplasmata archaeon]